MRQLFAWPGLLAALLAYLASAGALASGRLDMGFYLPGLREADVADVKVTLQFWADEVARSHGMTAFAHTYDDMGLLARDGRAGRIHMVVAPGMELADHFAPGELAQGFVTVRHGVTEGLALVVRRQEGIARFADLAGKRLLRLSQDRLSAVFLDKQCLRWLGSGCDGRMQVAEEKRDHPAILKVFFGQADAALVHLDALQTAGELNPQVRQRIRSLLEWPTRATGFGMMMANSDPDLRQRSVAAALGVQRTARGRQILELFRSDRLELVDASALQPFWELRSHQPTPPAAHSTRNK